MQNPLENFLLNLAEKIQTEKEYKEIVKNSESVDVNKDVFAGFIEGIANTIKENVKNEPTEEKPSEPDPLENFLSTLGEKLKNLPEKKKEEEPIKQEEPVKENEPVKQEEPVEEPKPVETKPENEPIKSEENETPDAFAGFVNNLANILKKTPEQKIEQPVENEKPKEQVNDYVKVLSNNKKVKTPEIKIVEKKPEENEETPDIKKFVANFVTKELESFKNDLTEKYLKKAAVLSEYAGGGGTNAVQYANGGVMNGDLNVNGHILSGGRDISNFFGNGGGGGTQTLSFNPSNADLSISGGNTVSLSALSGGGSGPTDRLVNGSYQVVLSSNGDLKLPGPIVTASNSKLDLVGFGPNTAYLTTTPDDSTALFMGAGVAELRANTYVSITTNVNDTSGNTPHLWEFGTDGSLGFPDNLTIGNSTISNLTLNDYGGGSSVLSGSQIEVVGAGTTITSGVTSTAGASILAARGQVTLDSNKAVMEYGLINSLDGGSSLISQNRFAAENDAVMEQANINLLDESSSLIVQNQVIVNSNVLIGRRVTNILDGNTLTNFSGWTFDNTYGSLTFPQSSYIGPLYDVNDSWFVTSPVGPGGIASADRQQYIQVNNGSDVLIGTGWPLSAHEWAFGIDGSLRFPDNTTQTTAFTGIPDNIAYTNQDTVFEKNVTINGNLTALGTSTFKNTIFTTTSALSVVNTGPGPALYVYQAAGASDVASFYDGDGIEVLHVGNANPGGKGFVGINESFPGSELTVNGAISSNSVITVLGGNSNQWNSNYTTSNTNSARWESAYTSFNANSGKYDSNYTTTNSNSANWSQAYTNLTSNSAAYLSGVDISLLATTSASWNSVYSTTQNNSARWSSVYTSFNTNSAKYDSNYTSFNTNSAKYDSNYTTTNTNSSRWSNWSSVSGNYALGSQYVKLSGDTMTGALSTTVLSADSIFLKGTTRVTSVNKTNVLIGDNTTAGNSNLSGSTHNFIFGIYTGTQLTTSNNNVMMGLSAGGNLKKINNNVFMGQGAAGCAQYVRESNFSTVPVSCILQNNFVAGNQAGFWLSQRAKNNRYKQYDSCGNPYYAYNQYCNASKNNILIGYKAGHCSSHSACNNIFLGYCAGGGQASGKCNSNNTFLGYKAGACIGGYSYNNTLIGFRAGYSMTYARNNTFIGYKAGTSITGGSNNTFIGFCAGASNTTGACNMFIGFCAGSRNTWGYSNFFLGPQAGGCNTSGNVNVFIGYRAGYFNTCGTGNTFIGRNAGISNTSGSRNIFIGCRAGAQSSTTSDNIALGRYAGYCAGGSNVFLGYKAGYVNKGPSNIAIGNCALASGTGNGNIALGDQALVGGGGNWNSAMGLKSGFRNSGCFNTFSGFCAGYCNGTGCNNNFIGRGSGSCSGLGSLAAFSGSDNNVFGTFAGYKMGSGSNNNFIGNRAGGCTAYGSYNTFIGRLAGCVNNTGSNNIIIGNNANTSTSGLSGVIVLGTGAIATASNQLVFGSTTTPLSGLLNGNLRVTSFVTAPTLSAVAPSTTIDIAPLQVLGNSTRSVFGQFQNFTAGVSASTDISVYNNTSNYLDMGIASSTYNGNLYSPVFNVVGAGDSYLYTTANDLMIGTSSAGTGNDIVFFTGGTLSGSNGNERMRITNIGNVGIGTDSPSQRLTVSGNISASGTLSASGTGYNYFAGNVGIGTLLPGSALTVSGAISSNSGLSAANITLTNANVITPVSVTDAGQYLIININGTSQAMRLFNYTT